MALNKQTARQLAEQQKILIENIPHLDEDVWIMPMSGAERLEYLAEGHAGEEKSPVTEMFELVAKCVVDEDGKRIYEDDELHLLAALNLKSVRFVADKVSRLMGLNLDESEEN